MTRDRVAEIHYYEWRIGAWAVSETRDRLDASGRGIYRELIDHCYAQGKIPDDNEWMCRRCACTPEELARAWKHIGRHFPRVNRTAYRHNIYADIFRKEYARYVDQQRKNRQLPNRNDTKMQGRQKNRNDNSTEINEIDNDGRTNGNGNGNGNVSQSIVHAWTEEELAVATWLREFPGASALTGEPDLEIIRRCLALGPTDRLKWAMRELGIARKAPSRSWAWFPVALASQIGKKGELYT